MLNYQHIITASIGDFGRSQFIIVFACVMTKFFSAWCMLMMGFAGAKPNWWTQTISYNATTNTSTTIKHIKECPTFDNQTIYFDDDIFTIVSEWNLVCGRDWIPTLITTTQMIGVLVGAAVIGQLGDWIGRKKSLVFVAAMELVCVLLLGLSVNWHMMTAAAFFLGFSLGGYLVVISVYMLEYIGTKWRTPIGLIPSWALGVTVLGGMFKLLPNWRHLCYATAALGSPFVLLLSFSPESIRWLFIKGKNEKAKSILKKLAARNKRPDPDFKEIDKVLEEKTKTNENSLIQYNYLTVLLKDATRKKALLFAFMWFSCSFTYYGLTLGVGNLSGDISVNMSLMGLGETICLLLVNPLSKYFGRKYTTLLLFMCTAFTSFGITLAYFLSSSNFEKIMNVLALISRFFLSGAWGSLIIYTTESFPTVVRSAAFGFVSVVARVAGILAPQNEFLVKVATHLPFTVNGGLALISALLCLLLENTHNLAMEDHLPNKKDDVGQSEYTRIT
ncbi:solute carrier family 22 member 15-like isoform X2 [Hydractinia symbiolongicarpus]|uniref:solute carrier family 22 member 15-like isoform X2 n=1 Tax=Hydractinia symbiolongicarpus TaxID=13093 RepID=UPI00254F6F81|nr:solute carrier family 22 member 15-like isoform X2 [Hydractinia symbiolongicarpus]